MSTPNVIEKPPDGVTLRDYFAGLIMVSIYSGPGARLVADRDLRYNEENWGEIVATNAYLMADEMLKAREVAEV